MKDRRIDGDGRIDRKIGGSMGREDRLKDRRIEGDGRIDRKIGGSRAKRLGRTFCGGGTGEIHFEQLFRLLVGSQGS